MWFPKYRTKVMGAIQAEAQRGVKFIELAAIKGGPVTQVGHFSDAFSHSVLCFGGQFRTLFCPDIGRSKFSRHFRLRFPNAFSGILLIFRLLFEMFYVRPFLV